MCGLRKQVTGAKGRQTEDRFRGLAGDKPPRPSAPLIVSLLVTFRAKEKASLRKGGGGNRHALAFFILRVFFCFLKAGVLREVSKEDLNTIFNNFPGVSFDMLMCQNEHIREFGVFSGELHCLTFILDLSIWIFVVIYS